MSPMLGSTTSNQIILPEEFVKRSINFLLKKEDKDSTLKEFNIEILMIIFQNTKTKLEKT
jgi:hypothetical protein